MDFTLPEQPRMKPYIPRPLSRESSLPRHRVLRDLSFQGFFELFWVRQSPTPPLAQGPKSETSIRPSRSRKTSFLGALKASTLIAEARRRWHAIRLRPFLVRQPFLLHSRVLVCCFSLPGFGCSIFRSFGLRSRGLLVFLLRDPKP